ncbi:maleylpyruvate isomerase family mycothiol-dependent enzyme [Actinomadura rubrisoli]|uniref:Maleylpyruvate isomerase family mycothiol-dependent enzyme n=1 Tax=Actinomadura rubrisoli TaxID=2530368 RepID=A0A4R5C9X2_9ACTN|nr:maleylpyruvate isomerase family mycothiol-dependent enzyme [Actinomadura rubrisoli]TDD96711.1 maleylpyruvate isomerase family mycothiol-dependent enzyme [Actinomadura rubrisoli]
MAPFTRRTRVAMVPDVEAERLGLAALLDTLDDHEWQVQSLCAGWTVRDVVAHLSLADREFTAMMLRAIRARDFDVANADMARERALQYTPAELVAQVRETAGQPRRLPMSGPLDPLTDILVHGQDIARPLGRERPMPIERVLPALRHMWKSFFYGTEKRFAGLRFVASDADWSAGDGPLEVRGPAGDLLLLSTGRRIGLDELTGDGVTEAVARLK